jgi:hypothetical protein
MILRCSDLLCVSFPVCLGAVPEDVRVRALAAGRADENAVSLVPGSFEVGYVAEAGWRAGRRGARVCDPPGLRLALPAVTAAVAWRLAVLFHLAWSS